MLVVVGEDGQVARGLGGVTFNESLDAGVGLERASGVRLAAALAHGRGIAFDGFCLLDKVLVAVRTIDLLKLFVSV